MRHSLALVVLAACASPPSSTVVIAPPSAVASPAPVHATSRACSLDVAAPRVLAIPARLEAVAAQYFHASAHDDGLNDLIPGTRRYAWYDPSDLDVAVDPAPDMTMIRRSTRSFFFGWSETVGTRVARRRDRKATTTSWTGIADADAVEDAAGTGWLLGASLRPTGPVSLRVLRVDGDLHVSEESVAAVPADDPSDRRIGVTATGRVVVAWVAASARGLDVVATWRGASGFSAPRVVDHVDAPAAAGELALRSTTNLRVATEGADRVAIAWRPLVPREGEAVDVGSRSRPPERAATAEVRIFTLDPSGHATSPAIHAAKALPLGGTTGIGPWPLDGNGMASATVGGRAVFFWIDDPARVVYATPTDARPRAIMEGSFRLLPRTTPRGIELLLLRSPGTQQVVPITCR